MAVLYAFLSLLLCGGAVWLNGRMRRSRWEASVQPRYFPYRGQGNPSTSFFVLTGAFVGPAHTSRHVVDMQREGEVYVFDYAELRFDIVAAVTAIRMTTKAGKRRKVLVGWSLGGLVMFLVLLAAYKAKDEDAEKIELLLGDVPLGLRHLLLPDGKGTKIPNLVKKSAFLLECVRPGPVLNMLSPLVARAAFVEVSEEQREAGTDLQQLREHMAFLQANKLSLMVDQAMAIVRQPELAPQGLSNRMTYLQCGRPDLVIDGEAALAEFKLHFPRLEHRVVDGAQHVSLVEAYEAYLAEMKPAFKLL